MTSRREHDAQTAAAAAIARAAAHVPAIDIDWPTPVPAPTETPLHERYPITPAGAEARRIHIEETRNG